MINNHDTPIADWFEQSTPEEHAGGIFVMERPLDYRSAASQVVVAGCCLHFPTRVSPIIFGPDDEQTGVVLSLRRLDLEWETVSAN